MSINRQEFTTAGRDMLGRANAGETLAITNVVVGSVRATAPADLWPLTELINHEMDVVITQQVDQGDGILLIDAAFNSSQAPNAFELCELGVMAHIGAEPDRLYSVANVLATGADMVDPAVESIHAFKIKVVIDRAPNVTVVIGTSIDILGENIGAETVGPGWFKEKIANTLRFKRAVAGTGIELIEDPLEPFAITIAQKILRMDLDLYVPLTHPGGTPSTRFDTIPAALDYLSDITIPVGRKATIHVDAGHFTYAALISVEHPNGDRITITGADLVDYNVLSTGAITGAVPNQICSITIGPAGAGADFAIDDFFLLAQIPGNPFIRWSGCWRITNIIGDVLFFRVTDRALLDSAPGPATGTIFRIPTQLNFLAGGFLIRKPGLGMLSNLALIKLVPTNHIGLMLNGGPQNTQISNLGLNGWSSSGIYATGSGVSLVGDAIYSCNALDGLVSARGAEMNLNGVRSSGHGRWCLWVYLAMASISNGRFCGSATACSADTGSTVEFSSGYIRSNVSGFSAGMNCLIRLGVPNESAIDYLGTPLVATVADGGTIRGSVTPFPLTGPYVTVPPGPYPSWTAAGLINLGLALAEEEEEPTQQPI